MFSGHSRIDHVIRCPLHFQGRQFCQNYYCQKALRVQESKQEVTKVVSFVIKAQAALVGRLSLSVGWKNGPERGLKIVSFYLSLPVI